MLISRYSAVDETTLLDDETQRSITRLRFSAPLELQFRAWLLARNLPRTRASTAIYLGLIVVMTAINMLGRHDAVRRVPRCNRSMCFASASHAQPSP